MTPSKTARRSFVDTRQLAGSPTPGEPAFLVVGKIRRPHGVKGELIMEIHTDFPDRLKVGVTVFVGETQRPLNIRSLRPNGSTILIAFDGYQNPETAGELRNQLVFVRADDRPPLEDGEYYHHQLLGLKVLTADDRPVGTIVEILSTGANDVYVVQPTAGREVLLPALESVILDIDLDRGEMHVHLLPGLVVD
jgi:16S rRNA processing protein RimM